MFKFVYFPMSFGRTFRLAGCDAFRFLTWDGSARKLTIVSRLSLRNSKQKKFACHSSFRGEPIIRKSFSCRHEAAVSPSAVGPCQISFQVRMPINGVLWKLPNECRVTWKCTGEKGPYEAGGRGGITLNNARRISLNIMGLLYTLFISTSSWSFSTWYKNSKKTI